MNRYGSTTGDPDGDYAENKLPEAAVSYPTIRDAVIDQTGTHWIRYGTPLRSYWFTLPELQRDEKAVLARLTGTGVALLTTKSKNAFKKEIEQHTGYRDALVAARPGWLGRTHYVFGDGDVERPAGDRREVIIAFERNAKFTPVGDLAAWQGAVGAVVADQPIPLTVMAYAFVGPALWLMPAHVQNPQIEIVGEGESAKTTLLVAAESAWAGDPDCDVGGAETWDMTVNVHDAHKRTYADGLLALDEANLAGTDTKSQREMVQKAGFKGATTGGRKRLTDTAAVPNVRLATLSTSNVRLRDVVKAPEAVRDALTSRVVTIEIPRTHKLGVFRSVPAGFASAREAAEHLRMGADENYGVAGRAFIARLVAEVARDEAGLRRKIEAHMHHFLAAARGEIAQKGKARGEKTLAAAAAIGALAQEWGIIPDAWGALLPAILAVHRSLGADEAAPVTPSAYEQVRAFRARHRGAIRRARRMNGPVDTVEFGRTAGFLRRVGKRIELMIPAERFRQEFPNHRDLIAELMAEGRARTEGGNQPKHTVKVPARICRATPRVYCVTVVDHIDRRWARRARKGQ